ncbi:MAG TPA: helix-turn-helix domain-containing protein [Bryocella sp.]|nr:helix-turn-helix domain-containing protein [Bryocella sp.]
MATHKWEDIAGKHLSPKHRAESKALARAVTERMGYGDLRKARKMTQVELAERLQISQPSVAALEQRSDVMLSTLAKYIEALGGRLEIQAVFPNGSFNLAPPASAFHDGFSAEGEPAIHLRHAAEKKLRRA